jgi:pimeloyl-ACP methyl ester carboxylesterase
MPATVVLVHGAWHGAWCWDLVVRRLDDAGVPNVAIDNPSVLLLKSTLQDDADNVRLVLDEIDGPVVLVGHSYGGAVITDAGAHAAVEHLVYITAFALDAEESCMENALLGEVGLDLISAFKIDDGVISLDPNGARAAFYDDCPDDLATASVGLLRPQSLQAMAGVPRSVAWRETPSTYVVCTEDRALPAEMQRSAAARTSTAVEMPTSHSPFLSRPDLVADLLIEISAKY